MNEQIRERLIREAGFHFRPSIENTVPGIDWNCGAYGYDQCVDRLIELVAKECIEELLKWKTEPFPFDEDIAVRIIKEHFGVR